jgi:hypothetical protein
VPDIATIGLALPPATSWVFSSSSSANLRQRKLAANLKLPLLSYTASGVEGLQVFDEGWKCWIGRRAGRAHSKLPFPPSLLQSVPHHSLRHPACIRQTQLTADTNSIKTDSFESISLHLCDRGTPAPAHSSAHPRDMSLSMRRKIHLAVRLAPSRANGGAQSRLSIVAKP